MPDSGDIKQGETIAIFMLSSSPSWHLVGDGGNNQEKEEGLGHVTAIPQEVASSCHPTGCVGQYHNASV